MNVQVLVVTMYQKAGDYSLLKKMNIQTDAIVCNQCERNEIVEFEYCGHKIKWMSFAEKGVGLNRNNGLMRITAEICIFADDDMVFRNGYSDLVVKWFGCAPQKDIILFNLFDEDNSYRSPPILKKVKKYNYGRYGAARMAVKTEKIKLFGILFNTMFGGGCPYSCGEDSLFLLHCLNAGLRAMEVPDGIAYLTKARDSSWFNGYNDKFFFDKGVLYYAMNSKIPKLFSLYHCFKHRKRYKEYGWKNAYHQMKEGINSVR